MVFFPVLIISSVLLCSRQVTLSYCSPGGWGPATFHQHLTPYQSTLSAWGKRCGLKLRKPAGCRQTSICKLGLRNMCLLTKRKAHRVMYFTGFECVCVSVCVHEKQNIFYVARWAGHTASLVAQGTDTEHWNLGQPFTPPKCSRRP